jgi:hypothetical protein
MLRTLFGDDEGSRGEFLKLLAQQGEEPSFLRRAKATHEAWEALLKSCQSQRQDMLRWVRMHLANLARQLNEDWSQLEPFLESDCQISGFRNMYEQWNAQLPVGVNSTSPWSTIRSSLKEFARSVQRFNRAWSNFLQRVDLDDVNRLRSDYNKYYPIEKAAAFDSEEIGRLGFDPLEIVTVEQLAAIFPPLPLPVLRVS